MPPGSHPSASPGPQWAGQAGPYGANQPSWMRPGMRPPYRPQMGQPSGPMPARPMSYKGGPRNDLQYPQGSVEATLPLMMKRRKHTKVDVQPVDGWKLVLALKSGLLMESTWALDVINVLLYDDYCTAKCNCMMTTALSIVTV